MLIILTLVLILALVFYAANSLCITRGHSFIGRNTLKKMSKWQRRRLDIWKTAFAKSLLSRISRMVYLDESAALRLNRRLSKAGLSITPREYTAQKYLIIFSGVCLIGICALFHFYFGVLLAFPLTAYALLKQHSSLGERVKKQEQLIAREIPRFIRTLSRRLQSDRDLLNAIASYRRVAGAELGEELDILIAEMKAGNTQSALLHFESRLGTSEAFRLCGALRDMSLGIDQTAALEFMADDMARQAREGIRKELSLRPAKMRGTFMPAVAVCVAIVMYVLVVYVINNFQNLY